jgi:hypothetical protein
MTSGDGTHSSFRNVVGKFISHTVRKSPNQKKEFISRRKSKIKTNTTLRARRPDFAKIALSTQKLSCDRRLGTLQKPVQKLRRRKKKILGAVANQEPLPWSPSLSFIHSTV